MKSIISSVRDLILSHHQWQKDQGSVYFKTEGKAAGESEFIEVDMSDGYQDSKLYEDTEKALADLKTLEADHARRVDDLLECNNRLLERAREAESQVAREIAAKFWAKKETEQLKENAFSYDVEDLPQVFLQWKGTDACFDFYCECGAHCHFDGYFAYNIRCPHCEQKYQMPFMLFPRKTDATECVQDMEPDEDFEEKKNDCMA